MTRNDKPSDYAEKPTLIFSSRRNWTAVFFFGALSVLHAVIAIPAFMANTKQGIIAGCFCVGMAILAVVAYLARRELLFFADSKIVRRCIGLGGFQLGKAIPFKQVRAVRLSNPPAATSGNQTDKPATSQIDLLCDTTEIPCPATSVPRQQALCLAMMMKVRLIHLNTSPAPKQNKDDDEQMLKRAELL